jgi:Ca2+-binding RTX toxin-like protein
MPASTKGGQYIFGNSIGEPTAFRPTGNPNKVPSPVAGEFNILGVISNSVTDAAVPPGYDGVVIESTDGTSLLLLHGDISVIDANLSGTPDTITGGDGSDTIFGGVNTGEIIGGSGSSLIYSGSRVGTSGPSETLIGGSGPTTIFGGIGDTIEGGSGTTRIHSSGTSQIQGGRGPETIHGGTGDTIAAGSGKSVIYGGIDDQITGGRGRTTIFGGSGDTIQGGPGSSLIQLIGIGELLTDLSNKTSTARETVTGFVSGDTISFTGETHASIKAVVATAVTNSGNTLITLPNGMTMLLVGVTHIDASFFS